MHKLLSFSDEGLSKIKNKSVIIIYLSSIIFLLCFSVTICIFLIMFSGLAKNPFTEYEIDST